MANITQVHPQLFLIFLILNQKEKEGITKLGIGTESYNAVRDRLKGDPTKAHLDICPFSELKVIDPGVEDYDYMLSLVLPDINEIDNILKEVNTEKKKTEENTEKK